MILDTTSKSLEAFLAGAVATTQPTYFISYADHTATTFVPGATGGSLNGAADVTVLAAPAASTQRQVKYVAIYNADSASVTVTVQLDDGGTERPLVRATLTAGQTLEWTPDRGWQIAFATGAIAAAQVSSTPAGNIAASNVQAALNELDTEKVAKAGDTMTGLLTVNVNGVSLTPPGGTALHLIGAAAAAVRYSADGFAANPSFTGRRANGTAASPTALLLNDVIIQFAAFGRGATAYSAVGRAQFQAWAAENWTDTAQGTKIQFYVTGAGGTTQRTSLGLEHDGGLSLDSASIFSAARHLQLRSYTVGTLPSAAVAGQMIYVSNEVGGATPAFSDGTNWRRVADRAIVS